jgi:2-polyprenyl-3-methyl-5-hydroxy-6-metoxy-1,4-benzoquinol methylase
VGGVDAVVTVRECEIESTAQKLTVRPCPVCGARSSQLLYRQRFHGFRRGSISDGYDVVACDDCGMCYAADLPGQDRFDEYYTDSSKYDLGAEGAHLAESDLKRFAGQAEFVGVHLTDRRTPILDVGTATGGFLEALRGRGYENLFGVDPSPDAVRVAREERGFEAVVGGIQAARKWGRNFGLITYLAVLEHLLDPRDDIRTLASLLRADGLALVQVPDAGSFKHHVDAPFQQFSVEHINYFTRSSLANLMGAEGFSLIEDRTVVLPVSADADMGAVEAIYRYDGTVRAPVWDGTGGDDVREYVRRCEGKEARLRDRIGDMATSGERIYVWGAGTHTLHLLATSRLGDCRIEAFIDSNPHYAGATLAGRPVITPSRLSRVDAPILVSTAVSQSEIAEEARRRFGHDVQLILLY